MANHKTKIANTRVPKLGEYFATLERIKGLLVHAGLPAKKASLLAMHLSEIDEEAAHYRCLVMQMSQGALEKRNGKKDTLFEQLVELEVSIAHMDSHIRALSKLLGKSIDALDDEKT